MEIIILFILGFVASYIGSLVGGGGGFVSLAGLIFLGLPLPMAIATNRFATIGMVASATYNFGKAKKIVYRYAIPLAVVGIIGSYLGAVFLVRAEEEFLKRLVGILLILMLPLLFLRGDFGLARKSTSRLSHSIGFILYFVIAIYDAFIGAGGGIFAMYVLVFLFGLTYIESNATRKIPYILMVIIATSIFAMNNLIVYGKGAIMLVGMLVGGYFGSKTALVKGNVFVRIILGIVIVLSAVRLLFA